MKHLTLPAITMILLLAACSPAAAIPTTLDINSLQTQAVQTAYAELTQLAPAATITSTPLPTDTPLPPATSTPEFDFSKIKYTNLYFNSTTEMVLIFSLNGARGEFNLIGNNYQYACTPSRDNPDQIVCRGAYQAPGREVVFSLYETSRVDPIYSVDLVIPSFYPPTPEGLICEIEPLWVLPLTGPEGCYAVSCQLNGVPYPGTPNSCDQPWQWPVP
jgi:hypothetical protein